RDADRRATLQRRYAINSPSEAANAFRPVETVREIAIVLLRGRRSCVAGQDHVARIARLGQTCGQVDALAPLRQAEGTRVDDAICPPIAECLELVDDETHRVAAGEPEHEAHILEQNPRNAPLAQQAENVIHQAGLSALDTRRLASLRQILAGKTARQEGHRIRQGAELRDVW